MGIIHLTDNDFQARIKESSLPVVVDFWADWCGPCKQIAPALEELSVELADQVTIAKVDIDNNQDTPTNLGVRGIPTLYIFKEGEAVSNLTGARPKQALKKWILDSI